MLFEKEEKISATIGGWFQLHTYLGGPSECKSRTFRYPTKEVESFCSHDLDRRRVDYCGWKGKIYRSYINAITGLAGKEGLAKTAKDYSPASFSTLTSRTSDIRARPRKGASNGKDLSGRDRERRREKRQDRRSEKRRRKRERADACV